MSTCSTVIKASTRRESGWPEIRVEDIGDHSSCFVPGARSIEEQMRWSKCKLHR
jgi:hypothetical protein